MEVKSVGSSKFLLLSWGDVERGADALAEKIVDGGCSVDTIIGVLRGGMIVADFLSDILDVREVYVIGCRSYTGTVSTELKIYHDLALERLDGRNVLLVDDVADTGSTLDAAVEKILKPRNPNSVTTATLLKKPWSRYTPDYFVDETDAWIVFPWERLEAVKTVGKIFVENMGFDAAVDELAALTRLDKRKVLSVIKVLQRT
ncbi:phosphoribosyltransferase [Candidatus Caldarchaeum subterraneum]|uniref:Phosphoribosyltransferase n=1 Tax=Caldiarchaeum subterraneum TaxID=311458 RepID=E6N2U9_CALS0|nr:phosphoribosyltransferase [Candidatus Caldarchaeum subterraneum]BAJ50225.1 phosphoribosyltransferase [Candidatus Caldarchaeum subterraneum]GBC72378.1 Hypoxanthine phosphoribosyltransferase [archaeon HR03]